MPCYMLPSAVAEPALDAPHVQAWRKTERDLAAHASARMLCHTPLKARGSMFQGQQRDWWRCQSPPVVPNVSSLGRNSGPWDRALPQTGKRTRASSRRFGLAHAAFDDLGKRETRADKAISRRATLTTYKVTVQTIFPHCAESWSVGPADVESRSRTDVVLTPYLCRKMHGDQIPRLMLTSEASVKCLPSKSFHHTTGADGQRRHVGWRMTGYLPLRTLFWERWWTRHSGSFTHNLGRVCA